MREQLLPELEYVRIGDGAYGDVGHRQPADRDYDGPYGLRRTNLRGGAVRGGGVRPDRGHDGVGRGARVVESRPGNVGGRCSTKGQGRKDQAEGNDGAQDQQ